MCSTDGLLGLPIRLDCGELFDMSSFYQTVLNITKLNMSFANNKSITRCEFLLNTVIEQCFTNGLLGLSSRLNCRELFDMCISYQPV